MRHIAVWSCILLLAASPLVGQSSRPSRNEPGPTAFILAHRGELALTASQVQELERVGARLTAENRRLEGIVQAYDDAVLNAEQQGESGRGNTELPGRMRERRNQMREAALQLQDNLRREVTDARAILTEEQWRRVGELLGGSTSPDGTRRRER